MTGQPHPIDIHVGSRVRMRRVLLGMSQEELGRNLGLTFQQVQKYEKGTNRVSASRLAQIAEILGVTPMFFFDALPEGATGTKKNGQAANKPPIESILQSPDGLQLNRAFARIEDPKVRRSLVDLVRAVADSNEASAQQPASPASTTP